MGENDTPARGIMGNNHTSPERVMGLMQPKGCITGPEGCIKPIYSQLYVSILQKVWLRTRII